MADIIKNCHYIRLINKNIKNYNTFQFKIKKKKKKRNLNETAY